MTKCPQERYNRQNLYRMFMMEESMILDQTQPYYYLKEVKQTVVNSLLSAGLPVIKVPWWHIKIKNRHSIFWLVQAKLQLAVKLKWSNRVMWYLCPEMYLTQVKHFLQTWFTCA